MKTKKQAVIDQNYCCAVCDEPFRGGATTYYHKKSGTALCSRRCTIIATLIVSAIEQFGSPDGFVKRFAAFVTAAGLNTDPSIDNILPDCSIDAQGRAVDRDGNIYNEEGTVIGATEEARRAIVGGADNDA